MRQPGQAMVRPEGTYRPDHLARIELVTLAKLTPTNRHGLTCVGDESKLISPISFSGQYKNNIIVVVAIRTIPVRAK